MKFDITAEINHLIQLNSEEIELFISALELERGCYTDQYDIPFKGNEKTVERLDNMIKKLQDLPKIK